MILLRPWLEPPLSAIDREVHEIGCHLWRMRQKRHLLERRALCEMGSIQQALLMHGGLSGGDPNFSNVSLLVPMNGTNGGTSFPDVSSFAHALTPTGWTTSTVQNQWGGSSGLAAGAGSNIAFTSGSEMVYPGDFSIEFWHYHTNTIRCYLLDHGSNQTALIITPSSGLIELYNGLFILNGGSTPFTSSTWYFGQLTRSGTAVTFGRNGSSYTTGTSATSLGLAGVSFRLGDYGGGNIAFVGHMQDFRVTKGVARALAVPIAAFPTF